MPFVRISHEDELIQIIQTHRRRFYFKRLELEEDWNWKKATERFKSHEKTDRHMEACEKLSHLMKETVHTLSNEQAKNDQTFARKALHIVFTSLRYLGQQRFSFRCKKHCDDDFYNLVMERAADVPGVATFLLKKNKWMSDTIQNKIVQLFAHTILCEIAFDL